MLENKKPESIVQDILKTDFPMLTATNLETEELETIDFNQLD